MATTAGVSALSAIEFLRIVGRLKTLKRTGWVNNNVALPESVADHMYRMGMCCMLLDESNTTVNRSKCIKMAIVHDLAESLVGDITPHDGVLEADKHRMEKDALEHICSVLGDESQAASEIRSLWHEYEAGASAEAQLVKDVDKFEMILQADDYEQAQKDQSLDDFFASTANKFRTPLVQSWALELTTQRNTRKQQEQQQTEAAVAPDAAT